MRRAWGMAAAALTLVALVGCSSAYTPRPGRRLSVLMQGGKVVYVRDGQRFDHGAFGSGLQKAVRGVPQAEAAAGEYHERSVNGVIALSLSLVAIIVGAGRMGYHLSQEHNPDYIDVGLLVGGFVAYGYGLHQIATAQPYLYDAINIYNDSVEGFVPRPPPGGAWVPPAPAPR